MVCRTFIVAVVQAVRRLTVNAYDLAGMFDRAGETVSSGLRKALATSFILTAGTPATYQYIALAAALTSVIGTIVHSTS